MTGSAPTATPPVGERVRAPGDGVGEPVADLATTPAGQQLARLLGWLAAAPEAELEAAAVAAAATLSPAPSAAELAAQLRAAGIRLGIVGRAGRVDRVDVTDPLEAGARIWSASEVPYTLRCTVADAPPHPIVTVSLLPARRPSDHGCGVPVPWDELADDAPVASSGAPPDGSGEQLVAGLATLRRDLRLPGLVALVVAEGAPEWWVRLGYAEVATRRRPTRRTALRLGTASGVVTARVVRALAETGRVDLEEPVGAPWLAGALGEGRPVRAVDLLTHRAGLTDAGVPVAIAAEDGPPPPLHELLADRLPLLPSADRTARYSAVGLALLAQWTADRAGRPFAELAAGVLDDLGLRHTAIGLDDRVAHQPMCGYDVEYDEVVVAPGTEPVLPAATGAVTTLEDLGRLVTGLTEAVPVGPKGTGGPGGTGTRPVPTAAGTFAALVDGRPTQWVAGGWPGALAGVWAQSGRALVLAANTYSPGRVRRLEAAGVRLIRLVGGSASGEGRRGTC